MLFPTPIERVVELVAPTTLRRQAAGARVPGGSDVQSEGRAAADLQRVLDRRRRHRAARVRELRRPRRLRRARAPRHLREGRDRHRALRRLVARHQAQGRGRARRGRLPHLLRSARRRLRRRHGLPEWPDASGARACSAAASPTCRSIRAIRSRRAWARRRTRSDSPIAEAKTITKIPVLPISYGDAQPLLAALGGPLVPNEWRGGLPITYRFGAGPARVHLKVKSTWTLKPLYDVIATIPGSTEPDQWVIRGNHHDAWVNGAEDPISGLVRRARGSARARRAPQAGLASEAHDHLRRVGRRRAGAARLHRVGRDARR